MRYFGSVNAVKVGWSRLFYKKYVLLFTDLGVYGLYVGDLFTWKEKVRVLLVSVLFGIVFRLVFGDPFWIGVQGEAIEDFLNGMLRDKLRWCEEELEAFLREKASISIEYNRVRRIRVDGEACRIRFKMGLIKNYEFIIGRAFINDVLSMLDKAGFKFLKGEFSHYTSMT